MRSPRLTACASLTALLALAACGGGGGDAPAAAPAPAAAAAPTPALASAAPAPAAVAAPAAPAVAAETPTESAGAAAPAPSPVPTPAQRIAAATTTAQSTANACNGIRPFYWEIGDGDARAVSGSETASGDSTIYMAAQPIAIASSSKWLYASYVAQKLNGVLADRDLRFLTMRSGYAEFKGCEAGQTVDSCLAYQGNGTYKPEADGRFYYDGGHMQVHASLMGLGAMGNRALAAAMREQLGNDIALAFVQPQPPGGVVMSPDAYAAVLRKMIKGQLQIGALLGSTAVCTNAATCGSALYTPVPDSESWHYSLGHWVEDDPLVGDGAFSSAGAFGFYPWIDASKRYYGVVARVAAAGSGYASAQCGRLIRKAWLSGAAQQ